ncbi:MAG: hypothetical protein JNL70_12905 [Saprospiraceae bacterium]|nr:hypothetical protein [Saprospiraceae bacterium]
MKRYNWAVVIVNLLLLVAILTSSQTSGMNKAIFILESSGINFLLGGTLMAFDKEQWAKSHFLSAALLFLIGFGVCTTHFRVG